MDKRENDRRYYQEHRAEILQRMKDYRAVHPGLESMLGAVRWVTQRQKSQADNREYYLSHSDAIKGRNRQSNGLAKVVVLRHYSLEQLLPICSRCGEVDIRTLSLDHIKSNGAAERKKGWMGGKRGYQKLWAQGFPEGYQTLCMNCQFRKRAERHEYGGFIRLKEEEGRSKNAPPNHMVAFGK